MFKNILVPTDLTNKSMEALDIALRIGSKNGFEITLLHVIEVLEGTDEEDFRVFYERLENRAQKKMAEMVGLYEKENSNINLKYFFMNHSCMSIHPDRVNLYP